MFDYFDDVRTLYLPCVSDYPNHPEAADLMGEMRDCDFHYR